MPDIEYRMLRHTSDAYLEAYGSTLSKAFSNSSKGMIAIITDLRMVRKRRMIAVNSVMGYDVGSLLYNWLEHILLLFEVDRLLLPHSNIQISRSEEHYEINGTAVGEQFDPSRHVIKRQIKGVTYHEMNVHRLKHGYRIRVLFDL